MNRLTERLVYGLLALFWAMSATAQTNCANCTPCNDPCPANCPTGGSNPFDIFSANVYRDVPELMPSPHAAFPLLKYERRGTSRPFWAAQPRTDFPFGHGGNWRHSFHWTILDDGLTGFGEQKLQIIYPNAYIGFYHRKTTNDLHMTYLPKSQERILKEGTNYFLFQMDGTRQHITERTSGSNKAFRVEGFYDPYSNYYGFAYDTNQLLIRVTAPNTNQFITFEYQRLTNALDPGVIRFSHINTGAVEVLLAGSFNGWQGSLNPMTATNGEWIADVELARGFYAYKFVVRYSGDTNFYWTSDSDNPITGGIDSNSVVVVDPFRTISRVTSSDGRSVEYEYSWAYNGHPDRIIDILLTSAHYGDGTSAQYTYYSGETSIENRALLHTVDDPMVPHGPARAVLYTYQTNTIYAGMVHEERSLGSSQLLGRLEFDAGNENVRIYTDAEGKVTRYGYVTNTCNLTIQTNAVGDVSRFEYFSDGEGMLWKEIDPLGRTTVYSRTWHFGAVLSISNSTGNCGCEADVVNTYTDETYPFYLSSQTKKGGLTTTWVRDARQRPIRVNYPDGTFETNAYNDVGQVVAQRGRDGALWRWSYDARGRKVAETDPLEHTTHFIYDANDRLALVSNALGRVTRYFYDWRGMVTNVVYADGTEEKTWYNRYGDVTQRLDRAGGVAVRRYDALGQLSEVVDPGGATNRYAYSAAERLISMTSPLGLTVSNTYDAIGRKIRETYSSDGTYNEWHYDPDGVRTQINRLGGVTVFEYDADRRLVGQRDPNGNWTRFGYDAAGNRTHITNALGDVMEYTYDAAGRQTSMRDCTGATVSNVYDGVGRLIRQIDANEIVTSNAYDAAGRLLASWRGGLLVVSNSYNAVGWVLTRRDASGLTTSNDYDVAGRVLRSYMPDGSSFENVYSNTFLVQSIDRAGRSTRYQRDVLGRVTNQTDNATNSVRYGYDVAGNLADLYDQNGSRTRFLFDPEGRQIGKVYADGVTNHYSYDAMGRLISKLDGKGVSTAYRYDAIGNMTNIDYAADADVFFAYDALNRMTAMVDGVGTTLYAYAGSCGKVQSVDGPFVGDTVSYGYDTGKRLVAVTSASSVVNYTYDALDRFTHVIARVGTNAATTNTYAYVNNRRLPDALTHGNGVLTDYAYDPLLRLTNLIHQTGGTNLASYAYTYNAADLRTSVTLGGGGAPARRIDYSYDPIGQLTAAQGDFPGYHFDYAFDPAGNPTRQNNNGLVLSNAFNNLNQNTTSQWS
ncbi:MAG: hypothetical protein H3C50_10280, partial [Kiritimatiellae bacterium]|nr:hypothetical protein [Kiritimatiellia bacterium]